MYRILHVNLCLIFCWIIEQIKAGSIDLPFNATWNPKAITVAGWPNRTNGSALTQLSKPFGISITKEDVLYISDTFNHRVVVIDLVSISNILIIGSGPGSSTNEFTRPYGLFTTNTSLYVLDFDNHRVQKMLLDGSNPSTVAGMSGLNKPYFLYVDDHNNIYLSNSVDDEVLLYRFNTTNGQRVAGTGSAGANDNQLNTPFGVFITGNETLYIADCHNHRIMKWYSGASVGIRVAGNGTAGSSTTQLNCPTQVIVDINGNMYINERDNSRITRWRDGASSGECIAACTGTNGSASNQLDGPHSLAFDRHGSLYVCDRQNHRIQKFQLLQPHSEALNRPTFGQCASWNLNATTFAPNNTIGSSPRVISINKNNDIFLTERSQNRVRVWLNGSQNSSITVGLGSILPQGLFVTSKGDIYIDNGRSYRRVERWRLNGTSGVTVMNVTESCYGLFVDINETLYCSIGLQDKVMKVSLIAGETIPTIAAGTGTGGSASNQLNNPHGLFVDLNLDLYVADCNNNRIQRFSSGQLNGVTIAGSGAAGTITLACPIGIMLDGNGYLFIVEHNTHRIVGSGPNGYRCIIGCSGVGNSANQLNAPYSLSFDTYGNIFVTDQDNARIQKFSLATNSCYLSYNQPKFSPCATWNPNAITFANETLVGIDPYRLFVDINNTVYVTNSNNSRVQIWLHGNLSINRSISTGIYRPFTVFGSLNGDVFAGYDTTNRQVEKWSSNGANRSVVMYANGRCYGIFLDVDGSIYCCLAEAHQVVKRSYDDSPNITSVVAGNRTAGSRPHMLNSPRGIFVNVELNLYVADCANDRIQMFRSKQLNGTTAAGNGANGTISLNCPTGLVIDADEYLFIAERGGDRIVGSGPNGFRCIVGCLNSRGNASNQLNAPRSLGFDSYGNLFVLDGTNSRVQKFLLASNACSRNQSVSFVPSPCPSSNLIGINCTTSNDPCNMLRPCQNNATCLSHNHNHTHVPYICSCPPGFAGVHCESDQRPCQSDTCWNNGTCSETSNTTFVCSCQAGWKDDHCQTRINYCANATCLNDGVCQPLTQNYRCLCLGDGYSGRHCEIRANELVVHEAVSRSFAYVAIIAIASVVVFIIALDVLKYWFGIDPAKKASESEREKQKKPSAAIRFIYVNAPSIQPSESATPAETETNV